MARSKRRSLAERNQAVVGMVGLLIVGLLVAGAINFSKVKSAFTETKFTADLAETGGLMTGDDVRVAGVSIGRIKNIQLEGKHVAVTFTAAELDLGSTSTAAVKSDNAFGRKFLAITPSGAGAENHIPTSRTQAGYSVTAALGDLTKTSSQLDVVKISHSMDSLTDVLNATPDEFRGAIRGVSSLSKVISARDAELATLLQHASSLSGVLADRNEEIASIFGNGSTFLKEIAEQREVISELLDSIILATNQLEGLVHDHENLTSQLIEIRKFALLLAKYRGNLDYVLKNLGSYISGLGEAVGTGPFFQAYVQNLTAPTTMAPILSDIMDGLN